MRTRRMRTKRRRRRTSEFEDVCELCHQHSNGCIHCRIESVSPFRVAPKACCLPSCSNRITSQSNSTRRVCSRANQPQDKNSVCSVHSHEADERLRRSCNSRQHICYRRRGICAVRCDDGNRRSHDGIVCNGGHDCNGSCECIGCRHQGPNVSAAHVTTQLVGARDGEQCGEATDAVLLHKLGRLVALNACKLHIGLRRHLVKRGHHVLAVAAPRGIHHENCGTLGQEAVGLVPILKLEHIGRADGDGLFGGRQQRGSLGGLHKSFLQRSRRRRRLREGKDECEEHENQDTYQDPRQLHLLNLDVPEGHASNETNDEDKLVGTERMAVFACRYVCISRGAHKGTQGGGTELVQESETDASVR